MGAIAYKGKIYGGGGNVEDLKDVEVTNIADGDILEYDSTAEKWKNSNALSDKVDKVSGKGLSTNDYTTAEKELVATIPNKADSDDISGAKNASGNPIIIEDSANAYAEEVIANIEPIQEGSGTPSPDNIRPITGLTQLDIDGCGKNLIGLSRGNTGTITRNGITFEFNDDGSVTLNGTCTAQMWPCFFAADGKTVENNTSWAGYDDSVKFEDGQYTFSFITSGVSSANKFITLGYYYGSGHNTRTSQSNPWIFNADTFAINSVFTMIAEGESFTNFNIKFQFEKGNTATDYEPYTPNNHTLSLGRTVYGGKLNVQTGELVVDRGFSTLVGDDSEGWTYSTSLSQFTTTSYIFENLAGSLPITNQYKGVVVSQWSNMNNSEIAFHPSNANNIHIADNRFTAAADFKAYLASNPLQVCYELATPITYHLTPEQVKLLKGYNYITTNADALELTYQPDNVLGEILGESEGYTDRVTKKLSDELDELFNLPTGTTYSVNLKSYTLQNTFECPKDGIVIISIDSGETGMLGFGIYSPTASVIKDVYGSADHKVNDYAIVKKGMSLYYRGNANGTLEYLYNPT